MSVLSCSAMKCVYNMSGLCSARKIHVDGTNAHESPGTDCGTFEERGIKSAFTNMPNMNIGGELRQVFDRDSIDMSPQIKCDAVNCSYNAERICHASNVQITGQGAETSIETECETFIEK